MITSRVAAVWLVDTRSVNQDELDSFRHLLSTSELLRYRRFVRPQRQRQFVVGHILLRLAVGKMLAISSDTVHLTERSGHAPSMTLSDRTLPIPGFSLSHSGDWVACAVSADTSLGLDIEVIQPTRDILALALHAFDASEFSWLASLSEEARTDAFYHLWVEKEARYKLGECATPVRVTIPQYANLAVALCSAQPLSIVPAISATTFARHQPIFD